MANNSLFNALGGGPSAQVPQQAAPSPAPAGALGEGSIFQALAQSPMNKMGAQPAELGPMVADNTGLMKGNPFFNPDQPQQVQQAVYHPPVKPQQPSEEHDLAKTASSFFQKMKGN